MSPNSKNLRPFDFRDIAALDDTAVVLRNWFSKSTSFFAEDWLEATGLSAKLDLGTIVTDSYDAALEEIPRENLCSVAKFGDQVPAIWFSSAEQLRILTNDLLRVPVSEERDPKDLTEIEADLATYFVDMLADAIGQGWMGNENLDISVGPLEKDPRKLRLFRGKDLVTRIAVQVECNSGTATINWLVPKQKLAGLIDGSIENRNTTSKTVAKERIGKMPVDLVALLGSVQVPMSELADLKPGKLILLDQRIDAPMVAQVDGHTSFECWPGKVGGQQAIQVETCLKH